MQWWALAWLSNVGALLVTAYFWIAQPDAISRCWQGSYLGLKLAFVLWLLQGAWAVGRPGTELLSQRADHHRARWPTGSSAGCSSRPYRCWAWWQHLAMGLLLIGGALALGREWRNVAWLSTGLCLRGSLAFLEAGAYWVNMNAAGQFSPDLRAQVGWFSPAPPRSMPASNGSWRWVACSPISERAQRELTTANYYLRQAQEHLRRVADRDPLTALDNRRTLPDVFLNVQPDGAAVLFFDLDGFKQINDLYGHAVGDQCLVRFAAAVRESFRPGRCDRALRR